MRALALLFGSLCVTVAGCDACEERSATPAAARGPTEQAPLASTTPFLSVSAGSSCGSDGERAACWGGSAPEVAPVHAASGGFGACVVARDGAVLCSTRAGGFEPAPVSDARSVAVGEAHACALRRDGRIACWGANARGQLGDGTTEARRTAVLVPELDDARAIAAAAAHTCAIRGDGRVACWGGYPSVDDVRAAPDSAEALIESAATAPPPVVTPRIVPGVEQASAVAASAIETCALSGSQVRCWPAYLSESASVTTLPWPEDATAIAMGGARGCALRRSGGVACWGSGGDARSRPEAPAAVRGLDGVIAVAVDASGDRPCVLSRAGVATCAEEDGSIVTLGSLGDSGY